MEVGAGIWYVIRLAMLLLVVLIAVISAVVLPRRRKFAGLWRAISSVCLAVIATLLAALSAARPSWVWLTVFFLIGDVVGFFTGRLAKAAIRGGQAAVRRWVLAPLLWSVGAVLLAITILFGTPMLAALAMFWVVLAIAMIAGSEVGEFTVAPKTEPVQVFVPQPAYPGAAAPPTYPIPPMPPAYPQPPSYPQPQPPVQPAYPPAYPPQPAPTQPGYPMPPERLPTEPSPPPTQA